MSFKERTIAATLASFILIMIVFLIGVFRMVQADGLNSDDLFRLFGIVIVLGIVFTVLAIILSHILSAIVQSIQSGGEEPELEDIEDERDKLIDLKGTRIAYIVASIGVFVSMLTFVLNQEPLVMFTLLTFFGILASIVESAARLVYYRRGV